MRLLIGGAEALLLLANFNQCIMKPISPQNYRGIFYVKLDTLPIEQKNQFSNWIPSADLIKLKVEESIIDNCVNYQDYLYWFENFYSLEENYSIEI